ncbi:hypothetical protein HY495_01760 [Candidatus Woesearchaeota archaeon]|nr:hypothetical protein [Candidatus Woesearchaeota archaeon]
MAERDGWSQKGLEHFIQNLAQKYPSEAVAEIAYCPTCKEYSAALERHMPERHKNAGWVAMLWEKAKTKKTLATTITDPDFLGKHTPSLIVVYPEIQGYSPEECLSIIKDHAYVYAQDWFDGIPINATRRITAEEGEHFLRKTIYGILEARAYRHQLAVMPEHLKEERMGRTAKQRYQEHLRALDLLSYSILMPLERETIKLFLKEVGYTPQK